MVKGVCASHSFDRLAAFHTDQFVSRLYADSITENDGPTDRRGQNVRGGGVTPD